MEVLRKIATKLQMALLSSIGAVAGRLPQPYPNTFSALEAYISEVLRLGGFPNNESFRAAVCQEILHTDMRMQTISKMYYVNRVRRASANQLCFAVIEANKKRATPTEEVVSDEKAVTSINR